MRISKFRASVLVVLVLSFLGCTQESRDALPTWRHVSEADFSDRQRGQRSEAARARDALSQRLLGELTSALESGGPAGAIPVCRDRAPRIAHEVSAEYGLRIGRTSHRLRNRDNAPPAWAAELVDAKSGETSYLELPGGSLGVLFPIRTAPPCLVCHGETIPTEVTEVLAKNYSDDRATGFRAGELRGWFWIEVPNGTPPQ